MSDSWTGGCSCGAIRYAVAGAPVLMNFCQCRQCQRDSGTGHGAHVTFAGAAVELRGDPVLRESVGENGTRKHRGFCGVCGSPVFLRIPDMPDIFVASAGGLDEPDRFAPQLVMWTSAAPAWDRLDPALPRHARMPPPPA